MENEISGTYPIILDGAEVGTLTVTKQGAFWVFEADCQWQAEIVRLSVFGGGQTSYLGIMDPVGNRLRLKKKLSRAAVAGFPQQISHAGRQGASLSKAAGSGEVSWVKNAAASPLTLENDQTYSDISPLNENKPPSARLSLPPVKLSALEWRPCPCPCMLFSGLHEKAVFGCMSGAFIADTLPRVYLALPEAVAENLSRALGYRLSAKISILNENYSLFFIENGKLVSEH